MLTNVQLAAGGTLWVEGSGTLTLESGNAQLDTQAEPQGTRRASLSSCAPGEMTFKPTLWGRRSRRVCMT